MSGTAGFFLCGGDKPTGIGSLNNPEGDESDDKDGGPLVLSR